MGDKIAAKILAEKENVNVVLGHIKALKKTLRRGKSPKSPAIW